MLLILIANAARPCQIIVDLEKIVVAQDGVGGVEPAEEIHHAPFELCFELRHGAGGVDFGEGEAEFIA